MSATITVIIAAPPGVEPATVQHLAEFDCDALLEVIVTRGRCPSHQRNAGASAASGEILYFLDDDSVPAEGNFQRIVTALPREGDLVGIGGPSLPPSLGSRWQALMGILFAHPFCTFGMRRRYSSTGSVGRSGDGGLILANLAIKKSAFESAGGFSASLYPNEENDLICRVEATGRWFLRDPEMVVRRPHRRTVLAVALQLFRYGRGRASQTLLAKEPKSFLVSFGAVFLGLAAPLSVALLAASDEQNALGSLMLWGVCIGYYSLIILAALEECIMRRTADCLALVVLIPLCHVSYAFGILLGFFFPLRQKVGPGEITIEKVELDSDKN